MPLRRASAKTRYWLDVVWRVVFTAVTFVALSVALNTARHNRALVREGQQAHDALCVLKADLASRADQGDQFIADIVSGKRDPIAGITIADLQRSVAGQRSTLRSLSATRCSKGER